MLSKRQHHKTQSQEITPEALLNYLSNREALHTRLSNSPSLKFNIKQVPHQSSPFLKQNSSKSHIKKEQLVSRKIQQSDFLKSKGFMSPKMTNYDRENQKSLSKSRGQHLKTQPHSQQNSQNKNQSSDRLFDDYFTNLKIPSKLFHQQETSSNLAISKVELKLKTKEEISTTEKKHKQSVDIIQRLNFQKSLLISSAKNQANFQEPKSNSVQNIDVQKFQTHSSSQPLIEFIPEITKQNTTRIIKQDFITVVLYYKTFKQKLTIDVSMNKIQNVIDIVKQTLIKQFGTSAPFVIGIRTASVEIPIDYVLSKVDRPLSLLSNCPNQPIIIEPIIKIVDEAKQSRIGFKDFEFIRCIGMGGFSKVYLVREKRSGQFYAMKLIEKSPIIEQNKQTIIQNERDIMSTLQHPFLIDMHYAFESRKYLVFVLEYCSGGELFYLLRKVKRMSEQEAFFYFAEICLGMKYLHDHNIIYRDIKPENILVDFDGHIRIADFGLSKPNMESQEVAYSFCGSPEYMAPEMLLKAGHTFQLDLYCLGALLYELVTGLPPFYSRNTDEIYQRILSQKLTFPPQLQMSTMIKDLLSSLLAKNPKKRIDKIDTLLKHPWMTQWGDKNLFKQILKKEIDPPFTPDCFTFNFDEEEFGKGESEFLQLIKSLQQSNVENYPKEIVLKQFYYNRLDYRQKSKCILTYDDQNVEYLNNRLQTEYDGKKK